jgi:hypothetical protein
METSQNNNTAIVPIRFGQPGFWHQNKPHGYEDLTGEAKRKWDEFINSTPKEEELKSTSGTGLGYTTWN